MHAARILRYGPAVGLLEQLKRRRQKLMADLEAVERAIAAVEATGLQKENQTDTTDTMYDPLRQRYSERAPVKDKRVVAFIKACRAKGFISMRDACKAAGVNQGYVSQCLRGKAMPKATAVRIAAATGYAATPENWPNLGA